MIIALLLLCGPWLLLLGILLAMWMGWQILKWIGRRMLRWLERELNTP